MDAFDEFKRHFGSGFDPTAMGQMVAMAHFAKAFNNFYEALKIEGLKEPDALRVAESAMTTFVSAIVSISPSLVKVIYEISKDAANGPGSP